MRRYRFYNVWAQAAVAMVGLVLMARSASLANHFGVSEEIVMGVGVLLAAQYGLRRRVIVGPA